MPNFTRPNGVLCSNYVYSDKKNTFEKLKEFLFDTTTGRTDVVFLASSASAFEPNQHAHSINANEYHYTGGLIDGMAKAIIQGSNTRASRPVYGTDVQFGYQCNVIPNFDRWDSGTWLNANTTGVGGYLAGCSTAYDNYYYWKSNLSTYGNSTSANTGFYPISLNDSTLYDYFSDELGETKQLNLHSLWAHGFFDLDGFVTNQSSLTDKANSFMAFSLNGFGSSVPGAERDNCLNPTQTWNTTLTLAPEQPQRYWDRENSWYISDQNAIKEVGIGYIENGVVSQIFTNATTYGYANVSGLTTGITEAQALALDPSMAVVTYDPQTDNLQFYTNANPNLTNLISHESWQVRHNNSTEYKNALASFWAGKKVLARRLTYNNIITIRNLNIAANNTGITDYTSWKNVDGFRKGGYIVFRSAWANPLTLPPIESTSVTSYVTNIVPQFGIVSSADGNASTWQRGLPYLFMWGNRPVYLSINAFNLIDWGINKESRSTTGASTDVQLAGFPRMLSTTAPSGFFRLSYQDTAPLANAGNTKYKERGIIIKPNLGKFFDTIVDVAGQKQATSKFLNNTEKNNILSCYKSTNFKYCVNVFTLNKYAGDNLTATNQVILTAHRRTTAGGAETQIASQTFSLPSTVIANTLPRKVTKTRCELTLNLNSVNTNFTLHEIKLGFLGKGSANNTLGDIVISTHYGVDVNNNNGIAFNKLDTTYGFRSGDAAYQNDAGANPGGRLALYTEFFKAIYERQTNASLGGTSNPPKLVLMIETGIWESANPNFSYNGVNTWTYFKDAIPPNIQGVANTGGFGFTLLSYILNQALIAGFSRDNIVVCFYTPSMLTKTATVSNGTFDGVNYTSAIDDLSLVETKNNRATFIRSSEIFVNTIVQGCGYYNPCPPQASLQVPNPYAKNSCYINMGNITGFTSLLNSITGQEGSWYDSTDEFLNYRYFSEHGALALGSFVMDYLNTATSATYFVPPWIVPFSQMLNYTTDPVSGADLNLVTVSFDPIDINPYLVELDVLCDQNNTQAKRTLSKFKTKILQ